MNDEFCADVTAARSVPAEPAPAAPAQNPSDAPAVIISPTVEQSLCELYEQHIAAAERQTNELKTVRDDERRIAEFSRWLTDRGADATLSAIAANRQIIIEFARSFRSKPKGNSVAMAQKALNAVGKLCRWARDAGQLDPYPKWPTRGDLNLMGAGVSESDFSGEPVTVDEMRLMMSPDILAGCKWPELGTVPPAVFWETVLLSHAVFGFRSQDWFAIRDGSKMGLLWENILSEPQCPRIKGLLNPAGWCSYLVHKTRKKSQRAGKPPNLLVPFPRRLRDLIEKFRGLDPVRVFPLRQTTHAWSREFKGILTRAGLDDASRLAAKLPVIRLSEGKRSIASFRKGCAAMWADHVSEAAASYMLKHSVGGGKEDSSDTTRQHYLQAYRPLKVIVPALESLPVLQDIHH